MTKIIFSIDNPHDLHQQAKFLRHLDTQRALGKLEGVVRLAIGSYEGALEPAFVMDEIDFDNHVWGSDYFKGQECFLRVVGSSGLAFLRYTDPDKPRQSLGMFRCVGKDAPHPLVPGWTYFLDTGDYWVAS